MSLFLQENGVLQVGSSPTSKFLTCLRKKSSVILFKKWAHQSTYPERKKSVVFCVQLRYLQVFRVIKTRIHFKQTLHIRIKTIKCIVSPMILAKGLLLRRKYAAKILLLVIHYWTIVLKFLTRDLQVIVSKVLLKYSNNQPQSQVTKDSQKLTFQTFLRYSSRTMTPFAMCLAIPDCRTNS